MRSRSNCCVTSGSHIFVLPRGTDAVRLVSRAGAPSNVRPWLDDRRRLGVCVGRIRARNGAELIEMPVDHPALAAGWHGVEREQGRLWRWTDGDAHVPVPGAQKCWKFTSPAHSNIARPKQR